MSLEPDVQTADVQPSPSSQPQTSRKRRRVDAFKISKVRRSHQQIKYSDAYRELFNQDVGRIATRFEVDDAWRNQTKQVGASIWSPREQNVFFAALQRLGRDDIPGISAAIKTKSLPEVRQYLLLLQQATTTHSKTNLTLRDIPAAIEIGRKCDEHLDVARDALACYQELFEANQEQAKFGDLWLITPTIANAIEQEVTGPTRLESSPPVSEPETPHETPHTGGYIIVGSCISCKKSKLKCNREIPCRNCIRRKVSDCVYPEKAIKQSLPRPLKKPKPKPEPEPEPEPSATSPNLLEAIPEASLLQPNVLLMLSRKLFMNRCPDVPSPWLHWSQYTTELSQEPAIYRSAFNDLHSLLISVTRRLTQTAIIQATSRLRSQGRRLRKNALPNVKRRDVLTAIDLVGMKRNGRERWRGVARRCGLRVFEGREDYDQNGKYRKELSWDQVEYLLAPTESTGNPLLSDSEAFPKDAESFRLKASRRGTPLPMENLTLSDPDEQSNYSDMSSDTEMDDEIRSQSSYPASQPSDHVRRSDSADSATTVDESGNTLQTVEEFDQLASQEEQKALWQMLEVPEPFDDNVSRNVEDDGDDMGINEKIVLEPDDWRDWIEYKPQWEIFRSPVPDKLFSVGPKTIEDSTAHLMATLGRQSADGDTSAGDSTRRPNPNKELRAKGSRAYAVSQEKFSAQNHDVASSSSDSSSDDEDVDMPIQSIEEESQGTNTLVSDERLHEGGAEADENSDEDVMEQDRMDLDN